MRSIRKNAPRRKEADGERLRQGEVATVEALAAYVSALGGKLELLADIGGHLLRMPANPAA
jgi:hypothetical protein